MAAQFESFARVECHERSPLYAEICRAVARDDDVLALYARTPERQRRPNLLLAAIHFLLLGSADHPLAAHVPTVARERVATASAGEQALSFCHEYAAQLSALLVTRNTQTNEVNRCAALLPALVHATPRDQPIRLVELGASAGLNLLLDRYAYRYRGSALVSTGDGSVLCECASDGELPALDAWPRVTERVGIDLHPVDVRDDDAVRWLTACVFADQPWRVQRLQAALRVAREHPPTILRGDGAALVAQAAAGGDPDAHPVIWHSLVLGYTFESEQRALAEAMNRVGAMRDLTWIYLEEPAATPGLPAPEDVGRRREDGYECALVAVSYRDARRTVRQLALADAHVARMSWIA